MSQSSKYPTPLPHQPQVMYDTLHAEGSSDETIQEDLTKKIGFGYRNGIGELIYAMITCRLDLSYSIVQYSHYRSKPHESTTMPYTTC